MNAMENCMFSAQGDIICMGQTGQNKKHLSKQVDQFTEMFTEHLSGSPGHAYVNLAKTQVSQAQGLVDQKVSAKNAAKGSTN